MNQAQPNPPAMAPPLGSKWWLWILLIIVIAAGLALYFVYFKDKTTPVSPAPTPTPTPNGKVSDVAQADNYLGFNMLKELQASATDKNANIFISPTSIAIIFDLLTNGADGQTLTDLTKALGLANLTLEQTNTFNKSLVASFQADQDKRTLSVANSIWLNNKSGVKILDSFSKIATDDYQAKTQELDFNDSQSLTTINNWVADQTKDKIKNLIDSLEGTSMWLINAIYFKANWAEQFDKALTKNEKFTFASGQTQDYPLMNKSDSFPYLENNDFQAVRLAYKDEKTVMDVFLPKENSSVDKLVQALDYQKYNDYIAKLTSQPGHVALPKFKIEYKKSLVEDLKKMGLTNIFSDDADFSKISDTPQKVNEVIHQSFVEVNEEGSEAAAATAIGMVATAAPNGNEPKPFEMVVNRPFFFTIYDTENKVILFSGIIKEPKE